MGVIREEIGGVDFLLDFELEGAANDWTRDDDTYRTGPYHLTVNRRQFAEGAAALTWQLRRTDQQPVELQKLTIDRGRLRHGATPGGAVVAGAAVAVVAAGWPLPDGTTLVFGVAVLLWVLATMALEKPGTRP